MFFERGRLGKLQFAVGREDDFRTREVVIRLALLDLDDRESAKARYLYGASRVKYTEKAPDPAGREGVFADDVGAGS